MNGNIKASFYEDSKQIPDPSELNAREKSSNTRRLSAGKIK